MTEDLTPDQREALTILQEEAAELIQAVSKIKRHGPDSCHPDGGNDGLTNEEHACKEMAQLVAMMAICHATGLFDIGHGASLSHRWMVDKIADLRRYSTLSPAVLDAVEL